MADHKFLERDHLLEHMHATRIDGGNSVPEKMEELKAIKRHLIEVSYGDLEKAFLIKALKACDGNVTRAAAKVGIQRPNFHALMKKHNLSVKKFNRVFN